MIERLERWAWAGGSALACIAGMINAVGFMSFDHQAITHMTGPTTMLGIAIAGGDTANALRILLLILSFVAGAIASGFIIRQSTLKLGRRYGGVLLLESLLLFVAAALMQTHQHSGCYLAAAAAGLQNAMASTYSGTILRTTHLTGMFNDLGASLGHWLRGIEVDRRRIKLSFVVIASFFTGALLGALAFGALEYHTLYIPAVLTGAVALSYTCYAHAAKKKISFNSVTHSLNDALLRLHPGFGPRDDESSR